MCVCVGGVVHRMKESIVFHQDVFSPLEVGEESVERTQQMSSPKLGIRLAEDLEERREKISEACLASLLAYLFLTQA